MSQHTSSRNDMILANGGAPCKRFDRINAPGLDGSPPSWAHLKQLRAGCPLIVTQLPCVTKPASLQAQLANRPAFACDLHG